MVRKRDGHRCLCCGTKHRLQIDHINPKYYGGEHSLDNLQTLCDTCNREKATEEINFLNNKSPLITQPDKLPHFELPKIEQANDMEQWEQFLRRIVNFLYRCNAVKFIKINENEWATHSWEICLHAGNNPLWLKQQFEELKHRIQLRLELAKNYGRVTITITAPNFDVLYLSYTNNN